MRNTRVKSEDLFDSLGNEEKHEEDRNFETRKEGLRSIIETFGKAKNEEIRGEEEVIESHYRKCLDMIRLLNYNSKDIENFSITLRDFGPHYNSTGIYLSALINNCKDEKISIYTKGMKFPLFRLAWNLKNKEVFVIGNVGWDAARHMESGKLDILGSCENIASFMQGGEIIVRGNTGILGDNMEGGKIIVNGNADIFVGESMRGGEIFVKGNVGRYLGSNAFGGSIYIGGKIEKPLGKIVEGSHGFPGVNIFHRGKQIVKDGRILDEKYKS